MSATLFERLGGQTGITAIASDLVDLHLDNPLISTRFENKDPARLKHGAATFFITGTGGPQCYEGKDMVGVHKNMNISAEEFMAAIDDALTALARNNVGQREQEEVLYILYSMRKEVMRQ